MPAVQSSAKTASTAPCQPPGPLNHRKRAATHPIRYITASTAGIGSRPCIRSITRHSPDNLRHHDSIAVFCLRINCPSSRKERTAVAQPPGHGRSQPVRGTIGAWAGGTSRQVMLVRVFPVDFQAPGTPGPALACGAFGPDDLPSGGPSPLYSAAWPLLQTDPGQCPQEVCRVLWQRQCHNPKSAPPTNAAKSGAVPASCGGQLLRLQALARFQRIRGDIQKPFCRRTMQDRVSGLRAGSGPRQFRRKHGAVLPIRCRVCSIAPPPS